MNNTGPGRFFFTATTAFLIAFTARSDLVLETETAQLNKQGGGLTSAALQLDRDKDGGKTWSTVNQFEYGISDHSEILIEPFFYEWDRPKGGPNFSGKGDLEITPSYMFIDEGPAVPAVLLACKFKVPTAGNRDIGTGKWDYQPYLIFGKNFGKELGDHREWVLNWNLGYDFVTQPPGGQLKDQWIYDFSVEHYLTRKFELVAEIFGNSAPEQGSNGSFSGAVATEYEISENWSVYLSIGYSSDDVLTVRPGLNFEW
jgi:hypothetical protein